MAVITLTIKAESVWTNRQFGYDVAVITGANMDNEEYAPAIVLRTLVEAGQETRESKILAIDVQMFVEDFIEKNLNTDNVVPIRG